MDCACIIDPADSAEEWWEWSHGETIQVSRRIRCSECFELTVEEEPFELFIGIHREGAEEVFVHCICQDCLSLRGSYFCSYVFGELWSGFEEAVSEFGVDEFLNSNLARLTTGAREKACAILEKFICCSCGEALPDSGGFDDNDAEPLCESCFCEKYPEKV